MSHFHRERLKLYLKDPTLQSETLLQLDPFELKSEGVEVLAIDFDGVLSSYGEDYPDPELTQWLDHCLSVFGKDNIFILSNKPTPAREDYFSKLGIRFIKGVKKKPYPEGLIKIIEETQVKPESLLLVDDRLLTGILAAEIVGSQARRITKPYINLKQRPLPELLFILLRRLEHWFF